MTKLFEYTVNTEIDYAKVSFDIWKYINSTRLGWGLFYCSAWLRLKLNTKMGFKHHHPQGTFSEGSRLSKTPRFGMQAYE